MKEEHTSQPNLGSKAFPFAIALLPYPCTLTGTHCTIQSLDPKKHVPSLFDNIKQEQLWMYSEHETPQNEAQLQHFFHQTRTNNHFYVVKRKGDSKYTGFFALMKPSTLNRSVQIGYFRYSPEIQRTTMTTEAFYLMAKHIFQDLRYNRLEWTCDKINAKSNYAAERFGFLFEGCFREEYVARGTMRDLMIYSILGSEWGRIKSGLEEWLHRSNFTEDGKEKEKLKLREIRAQLKNCS